MKKSNKTIDLKYQFQKSNNNFELDHQSKSISNSQDYLQNIIKNIKLDLHLEHISKSFILIELLFCEINKIKSKHFLKTFHRFTKDRFEVAIKKVVESSNGLIGNKTVNKTMGKSTAPTQTEEQKVMLKIY